MKFGRKKTKQTACMGVNKNSQYKLLEYTIRKLPYIKRKAILNDK